MTTYDRTRYAVMHGSGRLTEKEAAWLLGLLSNYDSPDYSESVRRKVRRVSMKLARAVDLGQRRQTLGRDRSVPAEQREERRAT